MRKYSLLFLFVSFLFACSGDKADMPRLELDAIFLNGGEKDYSHDIEGILPLSQGDSIDVSFLLDGNGTDLKTFIVKNENKNIEVAIPFHPDEISDEFTTDEGVLWYKDGVRSASVVVRLTVRGGKEEEFGLSFYLNSKAPDCEAATYDLNLKTTTQPRDVYEE
ncbi:MAG: DUF5035 family protein [Mediterranea sp.]|jgi:hypothetical protein|nr:DUF5035 family protein [Mediterranea sp.]